MSLLRPLAFTFACVLFVKPIAAQTYPMPTDDFDVAEAGANIQRTMQLLAASTEENPSTVRILFYGQSITGGNPWTDEVTRHLRERFPTADIDARNLGIGGFASQRLVHTAEHDVYSFYPDLMIFHVYGAHNTYEQIIRNARARTATEMLIWNDHLNANNPRNDQGEYIETGWTEFMHGWIAQMAEKYSGEHADIRTAWKEYMYANDLAPGDVLKDNVHLNDHGQFLLGELIKRELVVREDLPPDRDGLKETLAVSPEAFGEDGILELYFAGNRVDVEVDDATVGGQYEVSVDGKRPSEFPEAYFFTRPEPGPWSGQVTVFRVDSQAPRLLEEWSLICTELLEEGHFAFRVRGSETGNDGEGTSQELFVSDSGRVVIDPEHWFGIGVTSPSPQSIDIGDRISWQTLATFSDFVPAGGERVTTVVQGIENGTHRLTLDMKGTTPPGVTFIHVYRPFWERAPKFWADADRVELGAEAGSAAQVRVTAEGSWSITGLPSWLGAIPDRGTGGAAIDLETLAENTTGEERTAEITLQASGAAPLELRVAQAAAEPDPRISIFRPDGVTDLWLETGLGWVHDAAYPWVYHWHLGWIYIHRDTPDDFFFYVLTSASWAWSAESLYPWAYLYLGIDSGWYEVDEPLALD